MNTNVFIIYVIILSIIFVIIFCDIDLPLPYYKKNNNPLIIDIHCRVHNGDNVFNMYYFNFLKKYLESNNIIINYYIKKKYIKQIREFNTSDNVKIYPYKNKGLHLSLLNLNFKNNVINKFKSQISKGEKIIYDKLYIDFFNEASEKLDINLRINDFLNIDEFLLTDYNNLDSQYKNLDILVINSYPMSFQYLNILFDDWDKFIYKLKDAGFKICTTKKVNNITCSLDNNLTLKDIGAMSTHSKIIIGINTGPMSTIFNKYTMNYVKKIYIFDNRVTYSYDKIVNTNKLDDIKIDELKKLL